MSRANTSLVDMHMYVFHRGPDGRVVELNPFSPEADLSRQSATHVTPPVKMMEVSGQFTKAAISSETQSTVASLETEMSTMTTKPVSSPPKPVSSPPKPVSSPPKKQRAKKPPTKKPQPPRNTGNRYAVFSE